MSQTKYKELSILSVEQGPLVEEPPRTDEGGGGGDTIRSLVCRSFTLERSPFTQKFNKKVLSFVLLSYSLFVYWIWDTSVIIYPQFFLDTAQSRDSIRFSLEFATIFKDLYLMSMVQETSLIVFIIIWQVWLHTLKKIICTRSDYPYS